jgi:hypothetical protein
VLDVVLPILPEKIEAQTISLEIDLVKKTPPELGPLGSIDEAFEDRVLDTLAVVLTTPRYPAEAPAAFEGCETETTRVFLIHADGDDIAPTAPTGRQDRQRARYESNTVGMVSMGAGGIQSCLIGFPSPLKQHGNDLFFP